MTSGSWSSSPPSKSTRITSPSLIAKKVGRIPAGKSKTVHFRAPAKSECENKCKDPVILDGVCAFSTECKAKYGEEGGKCSLTLKCMTKEESGTTTTTKRPAKYYRCVHVHRINFINLLIH